MKIEHAFIATRRPIQVGNGDSIYQSHLHTVNGYVPHLFRRRRLHRLAPFAARAHMATMLLQWLAATEGDGPFSGSLVRMDLKSEEATEGK